MGVTVASPSIARDTRPIATMKIPAAMLGRAKLSADERLQLTSTLITHARAHRVDQAGKFSLANEPPPIVLAPLTSRR